MPPAARFVALLVAASLWAALGGAARAASCSSDDFSIEGTSLGVSICAPPVAKAGAKSQALALTETFTAPGKEPYVRTVPLEFVRGGEAFRTIDDAPLARVGLAKTLHLTIEYKGGNVRLEHALLVPGAIALK